MRLLMAEKILIVEDEPALQETLAYNLARQGYQVETVGDGQAALEKARQAEPDLIVLDIMLPILDGFEVCRIIRQEMNVPILMLTARDDEIDRVIGLEMGADDYLVKPFSMREFLARVKAQLRRVRLIKQEMDARAAQPKEKLEFGDLLIDLGRREVLLAGEPLSLKPKEYDLLPCPASRSGLDARSYSGKGLGLGFQRRQPHCRCARSLVEGKDRKRSRSTGADCNRAGSGLSI